MKIKSISIWCLATALCLLPQSCDKNDPSITLSGSTSVSSVGMNLQVTTNSIIPVKSDAGTLTRVFGDPEDGFTMTEYVSDITDIMPETKGTIVTTGNIPTLTNYGSFQVNAYRAFTKGELNETGDTDNDDDVYDNGTKSASTKAVRDFSLTASYSGGSWTWATPHWRNKSVYSIWSMAPASSSVLSPVTLDPTMPQPAWTDLSSIADVDPTGMTDDEIEAAEAARQEAIQSKFRSLTFDYTLPLHAPTPASTSIYKDLLFAYNEEMREFEEEDGKLKEVNGKNVIKDGKSESFDVKFYHALAAVKFVLETDFDGDGQQDKTTSGAIDFHGADIHSVTLCYTDTDGNIVTTDGIATKGTCTASATQGDGSRKVDFTWASLTDKKPMHFVFNDGTSSTTKISGGYASTGDGVLFMIPQTATGLKVIVEFSKYGGTQYYTKVLTSPSTSGLNINWEAGKCYTYTFKIGEFHVPGELLELSARSTVIRGLKNSGASSAAGKKAFTSDIKSKDVLAVGFLIADYASNLDSGQKIYLMASKNGVDTYKNLTGLQIRDGLADGTLAKTTWTDINFKYVESSLSDISDMTPANMAAAVNNIDYTKTYEFGLAPNENETYYSIYDTFIQTDSSIAKPADETTPYSTGYTGNGPYYFAFRFPENADNDKTNDTTTFNFIFKSAAESNNCGFSAYVLGMIVLEVRQDPNLPGDFNTIDWTAI